MRTKYDINEVVTVKAVVDRIEIKNNGSISYKLKLLGNDDHVYLEEEDVHIYQD